ncbi:hypothetical protein SLEP1_g48375 [Rubroshorea leprosula]|uniref:Flagellar biosynthetic protein FliP n=1 Tax=Rubroshorea leprosula TaxID=152421 RepID=A0AAV5LUD5_9ROSI|nr:hypothetical protein SLEP1_g48375 [Rubroshorea leprosula]
MQDAPISVTFVFGLKPSIMMALFTVMLLVLPMVLPPLPPPPMFLMWIPVLMMAALVFLAFMPSTLPPDVNFSAYA